MWLFLSGAVLLLLFLLARRVKKKLLRLTALLLTVILFMATAICFTPPQTKDMTVDYAVLLGAGLEDGRATGELTARMELTLTWLLQTEHTVLIVSGGDPGGQGLTEAAVMYEWLQNHGAPMQRVLAEDRSEDTRQNLLYSRELAAQKGLNTDFVLILTSDYHQTRAQFLAQRMGQQATGLYCTTPLWQRMQASVREVYAFVKAIWETLGTSYRTEGMVLAFKG